jgi:hypothetical protein
MNSTINVLSIDPHSGAANAPRIAETARAWCANAGWAVWYGLQSCGARRALREMRLMGFGHGYALPANGKDTAGQPGTRP